MFRLPIVLRTTIFCSPESNDERERTQAASRSVSHTLGTLLVTLSVPSFFFTVDSPDSPDDWWYDYGLRVVACYDPRIPIAQTPPLCLRRDSLWIDPKRELRCGTARNGVS